MANEPTENEILVDNIKDEPETEEGNGLSFQDGQVPEESLPLPSLYTPLPTGAREGDQHQELWSQTAKTKWKMASRNTLVKIFYYKLSYIGQDVESLPQTLIDDYSAVARRLDLSFNKIQNLCGLKEFCHLEELVLDNNEISDTTELPALDRLHTLTLNKNKLVNLENLLDDMKIKFPSLTYLSLLGNTACPNQLSAHDKDEEDYLRYRYYVLYRLPHLKFLDSTTVKLSELEEAQRVGPYMCVVRGEEQSHAVPEESLPLPSLYTPLPTGAREGDQHQATFGKSKYVYYGKHSEGNRFIRNNDL